MDLQADGSWKAIRWPLPRGEVRDVPKDAKIHHSVLERMDYDHTYRPGNLIMLGTGGRGHRKAPHHLRKGEWVSWKNKDDPVGEIYISKEYAREIGHLDEVDEPVQDDPKQGWWSRRKRRASKASKDKSSQQA